MNKRVNDVFVGKKDELVWIWNINQFIPQAPVPKRKDDLIDKKNLNVIKTNRGGKHTYHGPGQKVVYFVLNLNKRKKILEI